MFRFATTLMLIVILYIGTAQILANSLNGKINKANGVVEESKTEIGKIERNTALINTKAGEYQKFVETIEQTNLQISENYSSKNAIPNMLTNIMMEIPVSVQVLSIENQSGKDITITAQAEKYEQLGYFKALLEEEGILTNITTTKGTNQSGLINITITGQLPY